MKITGPITPLLDPGTRSAPDLLRQLRPGQLLEARVIDMPRAGVARLQIGLAELLARTRLTLEPGSELRLAVARLTPQPELKVVAQPVRMAAREQLLREALPRQVPLRETFSALATVHRTEAALPQELREALAQVLARAVPAERLDAARVRQAFLGSGLFLERELADGAPAPQNDLKLALLSLLRLMQGAAPRPAPQAPPAGAAPAPPGDAAPKTPGNPAPTVMPQAGSAASRTGGSPVTGDLHTGLPLPGTPGPQASRSPAPAAALSDALRTVLRQVTGAGSQTPDLKAEAALMPQQPQPGGTPPGPSNVGMLLDRLLGLVQGAVARVQTHQAASLPADGQDRPAWQFELPLALAGRAEDLWVRIERRAPDPENATGRNAPPPGWTVTLKFDFAEHGAVQARVALAGSRVSSTFWCQQPETERRFSAGLAVLHTALQRAGLEVTELRSVVGQPAEPLDLPTPASRLLDTRA